MRGDLAPSLLTSKEAQFLAYAWQLFLLDDQKYRLMYQFNHEPRQFKYDDVLKNIDTLNPPKFTDLPGAPSTQQQ